MGDPIAAPVLWQSGSQLLIADRQPRSIHMLDPRDPLGGLPGFIEVVLAGDRPGQHDNTVGRGDVDSAAGRRRRNLGFHGRCNLAV